MRQSDEYNSLATEDARRVFLRDEMRKHNVQLADAAKKAGVIEPRDYARFQNFGYQGLYGGLGQQEIHARKNLKKSQKILDHMGSEELAANLFRATQTEGKLRREKIKGKTVANQTHFEVGKKVRQTIKELGGTMPENLPTADSINKASRRLRSAEQSVIDNPQSAIVDTTPICFQRESSFIDDTNCEIVEYIVYYDNFQYRLFAGGMQFDLEDIHGVGLSQERYDEIYKAFVEEVQ